MASTDHPFSIRKKTKKNNPNPVPSPSKLKQARGARFPRPLFYFPATGASANSPICSQQIPNNAYTITSSWIRLRIPEIRSLYPATNFYHPSLSSSPSINSFQIDFFLEQFFPSRTDFRKSSTETRKLNFSPKSFNLLFHENRWRDNSANFSLVRWKKFRLIIGS